MSMLHGARREIKKLRSRIAQEDREFRSEAPPVDESGLPNWDGSEPLSLAAYERACGDVPDEDLTDEELEARKRLAPYASLFERMERDEKAGGEP